MRFATTSKEPEEQMICDETIRTVQYGTVRYRIPYGTVPNLKSFPVRQFGIVRYGTVRYRTVPCVANKVKYLSET